MPTYRIKDWDEIYENAGSRKVQSTAWVPIPNKQDGLGYATLLLYKNGEAMYGAFVAAVLKASKLPRDAVDRHGWLTDDGKPKGRPLSCGQLALTTHFNEETVKEMLEACSSEEIDWIEVMEDEDATSTLPVGSQSATSPTGQTSNMTEQNRTEGTEQKAQKETSAPPPLSLQAVKLCVALVEAVRKNDPKFLPDIVEDDFKSSVGWGLAARLLLEKDKRPFDEALLLIGWCQSDDFWFKNILSLVTFRKQYTRLLLAQKDKPAPRTPEPVREEDQGAQLVHDPYAPGGSERK